MALGLVWEVGRYFKKDRLIFRVEFWESKSPFLKTPRFRGGMMAISRPEGSGHGEPHALPSLTEEHLPVYILL